MTTKKSKTGSKAGRRNVSTSPSSTVHPSPALSPVNIMSSTRIKLSMNNNTNNNNNTPQSSRNSSKTPRPRNTHSQQRSYAASHLSTTDYSSDSSLTPAEDINDDEDEEDEGVTSISNRRKGDQTPTPKRLDKGKAKAKDVSSGKKKDSSKSKKVVSSANKKDAKVTITGPAGRERRRAVKMEEQERRRARDAKFSVGGAGGSRYGGSAAATPSRAISSDAETESSYGDDEADHNQLLGFSTGSFGLGHVFDLDENNTLPEAFAGHEIEDLAYGAGPSEYEAESQALAELWGHVHGEDEDEEEDQEEHGEDEEMYINHLSGSEADRQTQSSVHSNSDQEMSDDSDSTSSEDGIDEFGFPLPTTSSPPIAGGAPLVLMENWDGQFVLVQPRTERSRSSRRGERSSRTAGSIDGSTTTSMQDQQGLIIDPDAMDLGDDDDDESDASSLWSGLSNEDDDGGDTTDSMAEEDMPMLDSPALQQLIDQQVGNAPSPLGADALGSHPSPEDIAVMNVLARYESAPPAIIVTDTTGPMPETPTLTTSSTSTPGIPQGIPGVIIPPTTPAQAPPTPAGPMMGTFHPTTDHPAQHAVIDGSRTTTKSPFTHRRRMRSGRAESMSSAMSTFSNKTLEQRSRSRKSKSRTSSALDPFLPFGGSTPSLVNSPIASNGVRRVVAARYSSIPGHPRYIKAQHQKQLAHGFIPERESTPEEIHAEIDLEDMLETSGWNHNVPNLLRHNSGGNGGVVEDDPEGIEEGSEEHLRHLIRFDRVPVSTYLKRNITGRERYGLPHQNPLTSSPMRGRGGHLHSSSPGGGMGVGIGRYGHHMELTIGVDNAMDTLAGPMGRMLVSPVLVPSGRGDDDSGTRGRRGRRGMEDIRI